MPNRKAYEYRNLDCNQSDLWAISGTDKENNSSGVLEWCYNKADAKRLYNIMSHYHQFSLLRYHPWQETPD